MNKNHEINRLTEAIELCLEGGSSELPADLLASQYAAECSDINSRLAMIATMIDSGGDMEALQVAEAEPRLVERAIMLSFGGEDDWKEYCRDHDYELSPDIDVDILEDLEKIYERKISPKHPLYKDYRAAVRSRDEAAAYELIKIIIKLNPSDDNAQREFDRIEHKLVVELLGELEKLVVSKDERSLFESLNTLEKTQRHSDYENAPIYREAASLRKEIRRKRATAEIPAELEQLVKELEAGGDWQKAAKMHAKVAAKIDEFGIVLTPEQQGIHQETKSQIDTLRASAERSAKISAATRGMLRIAEDVELTALTPNGLTTEYAEKKLEELLRYDKGMRGLRADLQSGDRSRVAASRDQLDQVLLRHYRAKRARTITYISIASLVLIMVAAYGWLAMQAADRGKLLTKLQENGQSKALAKQVSSLRKSNSVLLHFPNVTAQMAISDQWISGVQATSEQVSQQLESLEGQSKTEFVGMSVVDVYAQMAEIDDLVAKLPADIRSEFDARLTLISNNVEQHLARYQKAMANQAEGLLVEIEHLFTDDNSSTSAAASGEILKNALESLQPYIAMTKHEAKELHLPVSVETRVDDASVRLSELLGRVDASLEAQDALFNTMSIEGVYKAILELSELDFEEAKKAQRVVDAGLPNEDLIRSEILFCGDMQALKVAMKMNLDKLLVPSMVLNNDILTLSRLNNNSSLIGFDQFKLTYLPTKISKIRYSEGQLKTLVNRGAIEWTGEKVVTSFKTRSGAPAFNKKKYDSNNGFHVGEIGNSSVGELIDNLRLDKLTEQDGNDMRFKRSLVALIDTVHLSEAPILAKAYILNQLFGLMNGRKHEWGLHIVPVLLDDMQAARDLDQVFPLEASDWLYLELNRGDRKAARLKGVEDKWRDYFMNCKGRNYYGQLRVRQSLYYEGLRSPIRVAGVVSELGIAKLAQSRSFRIVLGLCLDGEKEPYLSIIGQTSPKQNTLSLPANILMMSPLYSMEISSADKMEAIMEIHK